MQQQQVGIDKLHLQQHVKQVNPIMLEQQHGGQQPAVQQQEMNLNLHQPVNFYQVNVQHYAHMQHQQVTHIQAAHPIQLTQAEISSVTQKQDSQVHLQQRISPHIHADLQIAPHHLLQNNMQQSQNIPQQSTLALGQPMPQGQILSHIPPQHMVLQPFSELQPIFPSVGQRLGPVKPKDPQHQQRPIQPQSLHMKQQRFQHVQHAQGLQPQQIQQCYFGQQMPRQPLHSQMVPHAIKQLHPIQSQQPFPHTFQSDRGHPDSHHSITPTSEQQPMQWGYGVVGGGFMAPSHQPHGQLPFLMDMHSDVSVGDEEGMNYGNQSLQGQTGDACGWETASRTTQGSVSSHSVVGSSVTNYGAVLSRARAHAVKKAACDEKISKQSQNQPLSTTQRHVLRRTSTTETAAATAAVVAAVAAASVGGPMQNICGSEGEVGDGKSESLITNDIANSQTSPITVISTSKVAEKKRKRPSRSVAAKRRIAAPATGSVTLQQTKFTQQQTRMPLSLLSETSLSYQSAGHPTVSANMQEQQQTVQTKQEGPLLLQQQQLFLKLQQVHAKELRFAVREKRLLQLCRTEGPHEIIKIDGKTTDACGDSGTCAICHCNDADTTSSESSNSILVCDRCKFGDRHLSLDNLLHFRTNESMNMRVPGEGCWMPIPIARCKKGNTESVLVDNMSQDNESLTELFNTTDGNNDTKRTFMCVWETGLQKKRDNTDVGMCEKTDVGENRSTVPGCFSNDASKEGVLFSWVDMSENINDAKMTKNINQNNHKSPVEYNNLYINGKNIENGKYTKQPKLISDASANFVMLPVEDSEWLMQRFGGAHPDKKNENIVNISGSTKSQKVGDGDKEKNINKKNQSCFMSSKLNASSKRNATRNNNSNNNNNNNNNNHNSTPLIYNNSNNNNVDTIQYNAASTPKPETSITNSGGCTQGIYDINVTKINNTLDTEINNYQDRPHIWASPLHKQIDENIPEKPGDVKILPSRASKRRGSTT